MYQGIDLSSVQDKIVDWNAVKASGISFVMVRSGVGNDAQDPFFQTHITGAQAAGLYCGCYAVVYPLPTDAVHANRDPVSQAKLHFQQLTGYTHLPFSIDVEWPPQTAWATYGCTASQICEWLLVYLQTYTQLSGQAPMVYTYPNYDQILNMAAYPQFAQYKLWAASYEPTPTIPAPWTSYAMWQRSGGGGKLPDGEPIDQDCVADLSLWTNPAVIAPPLTPLQPITLPTSPVVAPVTPIAPIVPPTGPTLLNNIIQFISDVFK